MKAWAIAGIVFYVVIIVPCTFLAAIPVGEYIRLGFPPVGDKYLAMQLDTCFAVLLVFPFATIKAADAVKFLRKNGATE